MEHPEQYFHSAKEHVSDYLTRFIRAGMTPLASRINSWGPDALSRILHSATSGKMLRAGLLLLSTDLFGSEKHKPDSIIAAGALELIQTGLLTHDDIMDRDGMRRGRPAIHAQYSELMEKEGVRDPGRTGESFGICVGDAAFFLAYRALSELPDPRLATRLSALYSEEFLNVAIAQIQDVYAGESRKPVSRDSILSLYTHKTGRYTCGLPLAAGALIAEANDRTVAHLWKLGVALGIAFQMQDDMLNLTGDPAVTGKPVGSDIREGKQTLVRQILMERATAANRQRLDALFGNQDLTEADITFVRDHLADAPVKSDIERIMDAQRKTIKEIINHLPLVPGKRESLDTCIAYILNRTA